MTPMLSPLMPSLVAALPEIVLAVTALGLLLVGAFRGNTAKPAIDTTALIALAVAGILLLNDSAGRQTAFNGAFVLDDFARFAKALVLIGTFATLALSFGFLRRARLAHYEYTVLVLLACIGMLMMVSANELISLYLGIELQSLALYVIAAFHRDDAKSSEAGLKYFVLGALSSGMLLYGASLVYGFTGSVTYAAIAQAISGAHGAGVMVGMVFIIAGLAFKMSVVPFHMWTPDVYEGAPTPVTAFFATAPKIAAVAMTARLLMSGFLPVVKDWQPILIFAAITSMALGAFAAIGQTNLKRLMAYSSIANMGYALMGLATGSVRGVEGVLVFLSLYLFMTLGVFAVLLALETADGRGQKLGDLAGLSRTRPALAMAMAAMMFSLIGIPPLAGFFGKFYVFAAAVEAKLFVVAVLGILTSVVSAFYYLRVVKVMYFDPPEGEALAASEGSTQALVLLSTLVVVFFAFFAHWLRAGAADAAASLF